MIHELLCAICFQPIDLRKSKTDEAHPVHEDCYALKMASLNQPKKLHRISIFGTGKKPHSRTRSGQHTPFTATKLAVGIAATRLIDVELITDTTGFAVWTIV